MRHSTIVPFAAVLFAALPGCVTRRAFEQQRNAARHWEEIAKGMEAHQDQLESEIRDLRARLAQAEVEAARHRAVAVEAGALREEYEKRLRELSDRLGGLQGTEQGDIEVVRGPEGPVVRIKEQVLFDSGRDELKPGGLEVLRRLAPEMREKAVKGIRVEGHTDDDPVVKSKDRFPMGNLHLSSMRAVRVAHFLTSEGGIPPERVFAVGYGEWRPIAPNATPEGKRRNRRVEIALLEG